MKPGYISFGEYWFGQTTATPQGKHQRRASFPPPTSQAKAVAPRQKATPKPTAAPVITPKAKPFPRSQGLGPQGLGPPTPQVKECMNNIERLIAIGMVTRARVPDVRARCEGRASLPGRSGPLRQYG